MISVSKDDVARRLAKAHYAVEPGMREVYRLVASDDQEGDPREPVKLLEVNDRTVAMGIVPVGFGAHAAGGIAYPSVILEITPEEFDRVRRGDLPLPHGWRIAERYDRPAAEQEVGS
jgi:hypothetical protein